MVGLAVSAKLCLALQDPVKKITCLMDNQNHLTCKGLDDQLFYIYGYNVDLKPGKKRKYEFDTASATYQPHNRNNTLYLNYTGLFEWIKFKSKSSMIVPVVTQGNWQQSAPNYFICNNYPSKSHCPFTIE